MSKKLFVGNLSWRTDPDGLRGAFEGFGEIEEVRVITDHDTGRSRGFGFITFVDAEAADCAIRDMNGRDLDGRPLRVNEAMERNDRTGSRDDRDRG